MTRIHLLTGLSALALAGACAAPEAPSARALAGIAPEGTDSVLVVDASGRAYSATLDASRAFTVDIDSRDPVTAFMVGANGVRVLRVAPSPGAPSTQSTLPNWEVTVSTAQMSTCDCNADGVDEDVEGEDNILEQIDTDDDGESDLDDSDDDNDGIDDDSDDDSDGSGEDDSAEDLDSDDDGRPDSCDDDDDNDGISDDDDEDEAEDGDDDGIDDSEDADDDNDGDDDDDDSDDDDDGIEDESEDESEDEAEDEGIAG